MTTKSTFTLEYHYMLNSLVEKNTVELLWTLGYRRIRDKEIADYLAKFGV